MFEKLREWWTQYRCSHWHKATRTWFDHGAVHRQTVCMVCGKSFPCPPIDDRVMFDLLDEAKKQAGL